MALKKRSRVSAQFNMSSLTDIIFLLLIFFMLTSSLVAPNALNLKLPGSAKDNQPPSNKDVDQILVRSDCQMLFNGESKGAGGLRRFCGNADAATRTTPSSSPTKSRPPRSAS